MLRIIYNIIRAFITGKDYDAVIEFEIGLVDIIFILFTIVLFIYALVTWISS